MQPLLRYRAIHLAVLYLSCPHPFAICVNAGRMAPILQPALAMAIAVPWICLRFPPSRPTMPLIGVYVRM